MPLKRTCLKFPPLAMCNHMKKKGSLTSRRTTMMRSYLNLPPLVYQKLNCCDNEDDINQVFLKLSALHCHLHDPLKELLFRSACEDNEKCYKVSYFDKFADMELPQKVYHSPQPDHMPLKERILSNKFANEDKIFGVHRQDAPLATVVARWTPNSMSTQYDQQSVIQELAKFGDIESVTPFGRQTIIVVFKDICSACKAMSAFPPHGPDSSSMQCYWHHNFMSKFKRPKV